MRSNIRDITGLVFGKLTAFEYAGSADKHKASLWLCKCECGNKRVFRANSLLRGLATHCGCSVKPKFIIHGYARKVVPIRSEYKSWAQMRSRCNNPKNDMYYLYGGRGIKICKRWDKFENFIKDMGDKPSKSHSLDRFPDKNGDYKPSNCRWATPKEQASNTRRNIYITYNGITKTVKDWSIEYKITENIIHYRLKVGKPLEELFKSAGIAPLKVLNSENGKIYKSIMEAARMNGLKDSTLYSYLSGRLKNKTNLILVK